MDNKKALHDKQMIDDLQEAKDLASKARNKLLCVLDDRLSARFDGDMTQETYEQLSYLNSVDDSLRLCSMQLNEVLYTFHQSLRSNNR